MRKRLLSIAITLSVVACASSLNSMSPQLYSTSAHDQGMECDVEFREVARHPTISVVRASSGQRRCGSVGGAFLSLGVCMELARVRGFEYLVLLSAKPIRNRSEDSPSRDWEYIVGMLTDPESDLARAFPDHFDQASISRVYSSDPDKFFGPVGSSGGVSSEPQEAQ